MSGNVDYENCGCGADPREPGEQWPYARNGDNKPRCRRCWAKTHPEHAYPAQQSMKKAFATVPAEIRIRGPEGDIVIKTTPEVRYARVPRENEHETIMHKAKCELEESKYTGPPKPLLLAPSEAGPGLRAQGGKYTEPGEVKIYCDNGNDEP